MVDLVAIVDTESTETDNPQLIELAAVIYSVKSQSIVATHSELVKYDDPDATTNHISRIERKACDRHGVTHSDKVDLAQWLKDRGLPEVEMAIAHSVEHEKHFVEFPSWLCTYRDFDLFPDGYGGKRDLFSMALHKGVGISVGHRAIYDCLLIAEIFNRTHPLWRAFSDAQIPHVEVIAPVNHESIFWCYAWDNYRRGWVGRGTPEPEKGIYPVGDRPLCVAKVSYDDRQLAKNYGFRWNADDKRWEKPCNPMGLHEYPFPVHPLPLLANDQTTH